MATQANKKLSPLTEIPYNKQTEEFCHSAYLAAVIFQLPKDTAYQRLGLYLYPLPGKVYIWPSCYLYRVLLVQTDTNKSDM
jgi:hypothetical protein